MATYSVYADRLDFFERELDKLNGRIAKYGAKLEVLDMASSIHMIAGKEYEIVDVTVSIPEFVGVDNTEYLGMAYESMGEWFYIHAEGVDEELEVKGNVCDHCGSHRHRGTYYFFRRDGEIMQIGSSCVKQYFGLDLDRALSHLAYFEGLMEEEEPSERNPSKGRAVYRVDKLWAATEIATEDFSKWYSGNMKPHLEGEYIKIDRGESPKANIPSMDSVYDEMESMYNEYSSQSGDFARNMVKVLVDGEGTLRDYVDEKSISTLAYGFYARHKKARERIVKEEDTSEWIGEVGDMVTLEGDMSYSHTEEDPWGKYVNIYILVTDKGDRVKIKTTKDFDSIIDDEGSTMRVRVTGTVGYHGGKEHKYTILKGRLKWVEL